MSRYEMLAAVALCIVFDVQVVALDQFPTQATQAILDANQPGLRAMAASGGREGMAALFGVPFASDSNPTTTTDDFVNNWLFGPPTANKDALGVNDVDLEFVKKITISNGKFTVFTFRQRIEGLSVHNSVAKLVVLLGSTEKISYAGMVLWPNPAAPLPPDVITAAQAITVVDNSPQFGHLDTFDTAEKVVFHALDDTLHRAWRFRGADEDEAYLFFVDTNTGAIVGIEDQVLHADLSGTVTGYATPCCHAAQPAWPTCCPSGLPDCCCAGSGTCSFPCCASDNPNANDEVAIPLVGIRVIVDDGQTHSTYTDDDGYYQFTGLTGSVDISSDLTGTWVTVRNDPDHPSGVTDLTVLRENVTPEFGAGDLTFNPAPPSGWRSTFDTGQVNGFLAVQRTHDWFKGLQDTFTDIDENLLCSVNDTYNACSPFYISGYPPSIILGAGDSSCRSSAFLSIASHETGHFILDKILGFPDLAFHEGVADTVATLLTDTPCWGGFWYPPTLQCFRNIEAVPSTFEAFSNSNCDPVEDCQVKLNDPGCGPGPTDHCLGLALAGAFWDLRKMVGCCSTSADGACIEQMTPCNPANAGTNCHANQFCSDRPTEELFADFLFITDGVLDDSVLAEVLIADDTDGDLSNGTQHCREILCAFAGEAQGAGVPSTCAITQSECHALIGETDTGHGWVNPMATGSGTVEVKWEGLVPLAEPLPVTDYDVYYEVIPPMVTLKTTRTPSGDQIVRWFVGRKDAGGAPLKLGTVRALWNVTGNPENIVVQVGRILAQHPPCKSVNVVDVPAQAPTTWSNLLFKLDGDLATRARCYADGNGAGGLVSGTIGGFARGIRAAGIGEEGVSQPILSVGGGLSNARVMTLASGTTIAIDRFPADHPVALDVQGALNGNIEVDDALPGRVTAGTSSAGHIRVAGNIPLWGPDYPVSIYIAGDMSGDIIADSDLDGFGAITGEVTVTGTFNGDICDANLRLGASLPSNVHLTFGPGATICGVPACFGNGDCQDNNVCTSDICTRGVCAHPDNGICKKNRYVSFSPSTGTQNVAFQLIKTTPPTATCWIGAPDANLVSRVTGTPIFRQWQEQVIHVGDCEIIPAATYEIRWTDGSTFSVPLIVQTIPQPSPKFWGDTVGALGANGWTTPNGVVNVNDYLAALQRFLGLSTAPPLSWVDVQAVSSTDPCLNQLANIADVFLIIKAFQGNVYPFETNPANCPPCPGESGGSCTPGVPGGAPGAPGEGFGPEGFGPEGFGPESGSSVAFDLTVAPYQAQAGQTATVEVYIEGSANLGVFETALTMTPASGTIGTLTLESLTINSARTDYTFNGQSTVGGVNLADGKAGAALGSGSGIDIIGPDYLSTYTYRASNDASGVWEVAVSESAYLLDGEAVNLNAGLGDTKLIRVGVECTLDIHCDDLDGCTTDTCTGGVCVHPPVVCNDGNLCTTDACVAGACQYTPITCNDGNPCTTDACVAGVCQYTPITCNDGNPCTTDACVAGVCQYTPITCNDGNTCTSDACVAGVCVYTNLPNGTLCNDGLFCTKIDKCNAVGVCVGGTKTPCTGGQVCCEDWDVCLPPGEPCLPQ